MADSQRPKARIELDAQDDAIGVLAPKAPQGAALSPQDAPPVGAPPKRAQAAPPPRALFSGWTRLFLWSTAAVASLGVGLWVDGLIQRLAVASPALAWAGGALLVVAATALLVAVGRELAALARLRRVTDIRVRAGLAAETGDAAAARSVARELQRLYAGRVDAPLDWARLADRANDAVDADARLQLYEREAMPPLDDAAAAAVRAAAGRVATITALAPSILLDGLAALYLNIAMIRRIAEIYGGRAGFFGSMRLARRVVEHAMAVGLIALGDDLLEPLLGGGVASKLSRRLGEGAINGAMTARIGLAAMEVCRPLPFAARAKPTLRELAWDALTKGARRGDQDARDGGADAGSSDEAGSVTPDR